MLLENKHFRILFFILKYTIFFIFQVLIKPGNIIYKGTKSVVEFLVNNYTIVDAGGNRDTKKVVFLKILSQRSVSRWWCTL